jgi:MYXO-CTERM domain-containing protein
MKAFVFGAVCIAALAGSASAQLIENFDDPFINWTSNWLYQNAVIGNYYVIAGNGGNEGDRGNNPQGLWLVDSQTPNDPNGIGGPTCTINFSQGFGAGLTSLKFGVEAFVQQDIKIYDLNNNVVGSLIGVSGGGFDFDHSDIVSANSNNGISKIVFDSSAYGGGQIEGNTSVDNFVANVPTPGAAGLLGLAGLAAGRRRR